MTHKVQFTWDLLEDFAHFRPESIVYKTFSASPDKTSRLWQVALVLIGDEVEKKGCNIILSSMDNPSQNPVSVQFHFEFLNSNNVVFYKSFTVIRTFDSTSHEISDNDRSWGWKGLFTYDLLFKISKNFTKNIRIIAFLEFKDASSDNFILQTYPSFEDKLFNQFKNQKYTDLLIACGGKTLKAHQLVVGTASPVFEALLNVKKEENGETVLTVDDVPPDVFEDMLEYFYTGRITMDYVKAKNLLEPGTKYELTDLLDMCLCKIDNSLSVSNAVEVFTLFDKYEGPKRSYLKKRVMTFIKANMGGVVNSPAWNTIMLQRADLMDKLIRFISL